MLSSLGGRPLRAPSAAWFRLSHPIGELESAWSGSCPRTAPVRARAEKPVSRESALRANRGAPFAATREGHFRPRMHATSSHSSLTEHASPSRSHDQLYPRQKLRRRTSRRAAETAQAAAELRRFPPESRDHPRGARLARSGSTMSACLGATRLRQGFGEAGD